MFDLPTDLPADIVPLSWLLGVWEGTGVIDYEADGTRFDGEFAHRVSFSHDGGDVRVRCEREAGWFDLIVEDDGVGIPQDAMTRLGRPFEPLEDANTASTAKGSGLGVAIATSLVELHGGRLIIQSEVGRGTIARVRLPTGARARDFERRRMQEIASA